MNANEFCEHKIQDIDEEITATRINIERLMQHEERLLAERQAWLGRLTTARVIEFPVQRRMEQIAGEVAHEG